MIHIGTCGWVYQDWKGGFYPQDISSEEMLPAYAETFQTVEVNNTFYQLPDADAVRGWDARTPEGFTFAVKANRYITHMKNLLEPEEPLRHMMARVTLLGDKLGPILFQLPPGWHVNAQRLADFIDVLPQGRRYVFEFRHASWYSDAVYELLDQSGSAFCVHDHRDAPSPQQVTSAFVYVRFHGPRGDYGGRYSSEELADWAATLAAWHDEGRDVYGYFNNDAHGYAVENAKELEALLAQRI